MALLLLATTLFTSLAVAGPASCCTNSPYKAILPLSKNCFVQQYCSKNFPVKAVTSTTATSFITSTAVATSTSTISTTLTPTVVVFTTETTTSTTTLSSVEIDTAAITQTVTTTSTSIIGTSTTTVVTDASGNFRREAAFTPAAALEARQAPANRHGYAQNKRAQAAQAQFAAFTKNNSVRSAVSTACSCIQTPVTYLVKATSTTTSTSISTVTTAQSFTSPTTATSSVTETQAASTTSFLTTTITITTTSTTTAVATSSAVIRQNVCGQTINVPSGTPLGVRCGNKVGNVSFQNLGTAAAGSYYECLVRADNVFSSTSFAYQFSTGTCFIYQMGLPQDNAAFVADPDFVYSYFFP